MKLKTDHDTGVTTCVMSTQERKSLATAKTVLEQMAYHARGKPNGLKLQETADMLGTILATQAETETPAA